MGCSCNSRRGLDSTRRNTPYATPARVIRAPFSPEPSLTLSMAASAHSRPVSHRPGSDGVHTLLGSYARAPRVQAQRFPRGRHSVLNLRRPTPRWPACDVRTSRKVRERRVAGAGASSSLALTQAPAPRAKDSPPSTPAPRNTAFMLSTRLSQVNCPCRRQGLALRIVCKSCNSGPLGSCAARALRPCCCMRAASAAPSPLVPAMLL